MLCQKIIEMLFVTLNAKYSVGLVSPNLSCRMGISGSTKGRVVFIRGSHVARTISQADETSIYLLPKWRPVGDMANLLAAGLAKLYLNKEDSLAVDLLGKSCFMGSHREGMPAHAFKQIGAFHITGAIEGAPTVLLKKVMAIAGPVLRETPGVARLILLAPLLRFVGAKCCSGADHITNFSDKTKKSQSTARWTTARRF